MNNCSFCEYNNQELIEKTETKTSCCNIYYCKYHENDLFECNNCNKLFCISLIQDCENSKINKCRKCYFEYCNNCFYKNNICIKCK